MRARDELKSMAIGHLRSLQKMPHRVRAFFREAHVRYAADAC